MKKASKTKENKLEVLKTNWFGFNHDKVKELFEGDLSFVNDFCVNGEYRPVAVYRAAKPNKEKGHKKYMLLQTLDKGAIVRGMTEKEIEKHRFQSALHCLNCNKVIYSAMRHDMTGCACKDKTKKIYIDGGSDYTKTSCGENSNFVSGTIDLLTDEFILP